MRRRMLTPILLTGAGLICSILPAAAQQSTTNGFVLGLHLGGGSLAIEGGERGNGGGAGLTLGYGLNEKLTLLLQGDYSSIEVEEDPDLDGTWAIGHIDLALRFNFANTARGFVPYLQGGVSSRVVNIQDVLTTSLGEEVRFSGGAFTLGGGIMLYANELLAFDFGILFSGGEFADIEANNVTRDISASTSRINLGVSWWR